MYEGVAELVFDKAAELVVVFDIVIVLVDVDELVSVFDKADETEKTGLEDGDFEAVPDLVVVIEAVIVFVDVLVGVTNHVGADVLEEVVVFVDVLEEAVERVGTTKFTLSRLRSTEQLTNWSSIYGGVDPTAPIASNNKNHRISVSI